MAGLLEAILLPNTVAVLKCTAHTKGSDDVSKGNAFANPTTKNTAITQQYVCVQVRFVEQQHTEDATTEDIQT